MCYLRATIRKPTHEDLLTIISITKGGLLSRGNLK